MPRLHRRPDAPSSADDRAARDEAAAASPREETAPPARKRRNFYADLFQNPKRLDEAAQIEGVDDEIALLRTKFHEQMKEHPEDYERIVNSLTVLVRAVVAQYRMSPRSAEGFAEKVTAAVRELGDQIAPWLFTPGGGDV